MKTVYIVPGRDQCLTLNPGYAAHFFGQLPWVEPLIEATRYGNHLKPHDYQDVSTKINPSLPRARSHSVQYLKAMRGDRLQWTADRSYVSNDEAEYDNEQRSACRPRRHLHFQRPKGMKGSDPADSMPTGDIAPVRSAVVACTLDSATTKRHGQHVQVCTCASSTFQPVGELSNTSIVRVSSLRFSIGQLVYIPVFVMQGFRQ